MGGGGASAAADSHAAERRAGAAADGRRREAAAAGLCRRGEAFEEGLSEPSLAPPPGRAGRREGGYWRVH